MRGGKIPQTQPNRGDSIILISHMVAQTLEVLYIAGTNAQRRNAVVDIMKQNPNPAVASGKLLGAGHQSTFRRNR